MPGSVLLAGLIALAVLALGVVAAPGLARAANAGPQIMFVSPIYSDLNNGSAEGPVGAKVNVQGSGWAANSSVAITLADKSKDTQNQPGSACQKPENVIPATMTTTDNDGNMTASFLWPVAANVQGDSYWACGDQSGITSLGVSLYTVLSASSLSVMVSATQATAGSQVTVTGQNWLPGSQQIQVTIASSLMANPMYSNTTTTTAKADGTFSVQVQVPEKAPVGTTLYILAKNMDTDHPGNTGALHIEPPNNPTVKVIAETGKKGSGGTGGGSSGGSASSNPNDSLIALLSVVGALLLVGAVLAVVFSLRLRTAPRARGL